MRGAFSLSVRKPEVAVEVIPDGDGGKWKMARDASGNLGNADDRSLGSASAAANAEAARAVRQPGFAAGATAEVRAVMRGDSVAGGPEEEAPAAEPTDADPTDDREEGPSPDETTPKGDDVDEPEVDGDYDEEDHVEEVGDDRPEEVKADEAEANGTSDADKTWGQYKTEADRKKALFENKRYGAEMAAKAKKLEEENAVLKAGKPAADPAQAPTTEAAPTVDPKESRKQLAAKLYKENPNVKAHIDNLAKLRETVLAKEEERKRLSTEREAIETTLNRVGIVLETYREDLKADPDNYELQQKISRIEKEIERHERDHTRKMLAGDKAEREFRDARSEYGTGSTELTEFLSSQERAVGEQAKASEKYVQDVHATEADWSKSFPEVMDELKVPATLRDDFEEQLFEAADSLLNRTAKIPNLREWMVGASRKILSRNERASQASVKSYVDLKKKDTTIPAPRGAAAVATPEKRSAHYDHRQADKDALKNLTRRPATR